MQTATQPLTTIEALPLHRPRRESQQARERRLSHLLWEYRELKEKENPALTPSELSEMARQYVKAIRVLEDLHPR